MKLRLPKSRRYRFLLYFVSISLILLAIDLIWVRIGRHITIATDTTRLTSPFTSDGRISYYQALNAAAGDGTPPQNNAAIPLLQILGPTLFSDRINHAIYDRLSLPYPDATEKFYDRFGTFISNRSPKLTSDEIYKQMGRFDDQHLHLWSPADNPLTAEYLQHSAPFLDQSAAILSRPVCYMPLLNAGNDNLLISVQLPTLGSYRELAEALCARATLRAAAGDFESARKDLQVARHLAILIGRQPLILQGLVASAIDGVACSTLQTLATDTPFSVGQFKTLLADLNDLPPVNTLAALDSERFMTLDYLQYAAHVGPKAANIHFNDYQKPPNGREQIRALLTPFIPGNFNQALRDSNTYFDDMIAASKLPTHRERIAQAKAIEQKLQQQAARESVFSDAAQHIRFALLPAISGAQRIADRAIMTRDLTRLALALAAYHADHRSYPSTLADLTPTYLPKIPEDLFINAPLHYTKTDAGYLLYSVGLNMQDDAAHNRDNPDPKFPQADDLTIRVPAPTPPPPIPPATLPS